MSDLKHGRSRTSEYNIWCAMLARCRNPTAAAFPHYGGRGIAVCDRWHTFENFLADMGLRPSGLTVERKDNAGIYEPGNCYWATRHAQACNRRSNIVVDYFGRSMVLKEAAEAAGLPYQTVHARVRYRGWSVIDALTRPVANRGEAG